MTVPLTDIQITIAVSDALARHGAEPGPLMEVLHHVQHSLGFIPAAAVPDIARGLNLSRAEVHGVITYYAHFRDHPVGQHVVQVCRAESCKSMGADALLQHVEARLGCSVDHTSDDGRFTLEPAYCLGLCASSPNVVVGDRLHSRMSPARFDAVIAKLEQTA